MHSKSVAYENRTLLLLIVAVSGNACREPAASAAPQPERYQAAADSGERSFVGSDTCAACHTKAYLWWQDTAHARALDLLERRGRDRDVECIGCHVTGFQQPGGATLASQEHFTGVGCESCHGAGSAHANNPMRLSSITRSVPAEVCARCHNAERSPDFDYQSGRALLINAAHGGG
jgi:hypothetical protein